MSLFGEYEKKTGTAREMPSSYDNHYISCNVNFHKMFYYTICKMYHSNLDRQDDGGLFLATRIFS
jgi:hypothetical protein